jgi:hypothetical protein
MYFERVDEKILKSKKRLVVFGKKNNSLVYSLFMLSSSAGGIHGYSLPQLCAYF